MRDTGILIKNFADPFPKKNIVFTRVSFSGAHLFFFLLADPLECPVCKHKMEFLELYYAHKRVSLEEMYEKQCPVLVEKGLLHSFLFSLFYGTILEKGGLCAYET